MRRIVSVLLAAALAAASARLAAAEELEEPASCLSCHAAGAVKEGAPEGNRVDPARFGETAHRKSCLQCHEDMEDVPHKTKQAARVDCATCHEREVAKFKAT